MSRDAEFIRTLEESRDRRASGLFAHDVAMSALVGVVSIVLFLVGTAIYLL